MAFRDTKAKVKKDYLQALPGDHRLHKGAQRHQRQFGQGEPDPHAQHGVWGGTCLHNQGYQLGDLGGQA